MTDITTLDPAGRLAAIVRNLQADLDAYKRRDNANNYYIGKRLELINNLSQIVDSFQIFRSRPVYVQLIAELHTILDIDPEIERVILQLDVKKPTTKIAHLNFKCYDQNN